MTAVSSMCMYEIHAKIISSIAMLGAEMIKIILRRLTEHDKYYHSKVQPFETQQERISVM